MKKESKKKELPLILDFMVFEGDSCFGTPIRRRVYFCKKKGNYIKYKGIDMGVSLYPVRITVPDIKKFKKENRRV